MGRDVFFRNRWSVEDKEMPLVVYCRCFSARFLLCVWFADIHLQAAVMLSACVWGLVCVCVCFIWTSFCFYSVKLCAISADGWCVSLKSGENWNISQGQKTDLCIFSILMTNSHEVSRSYLKFLVNYLFSEFPINVLDFKNCQTCKVML